MTAARSSARQPGRHPIAVVANRTGLSVDVLRVWERRYGAVRPTRSPEGQRLYSDADVERLRLLRRATEAGRSIGGVANLTMSALSSLVAEDEAARALEPVAPVQVDRTGEFVEEAVTLTRALDGAALEAVLRRTVAVSGLTAFLSEMVPAFLQRIGNDWHAGQLNTAQEHLASSNVQQVILSVMRDLTPQADAPTVVVGTPAGERHAIGAALVAAAAAAQGWRVVYLGADLPADDIAGAARAAEASVVALSTVYVADRKALLQELRTLRAQLPPEAMMIVGGAGARGLEAQLSKLEIGVSADIADFGDTLRALP